jgi:DNA gyrase subunit A
MAIKKKATVRFAVRESESGIVDVSRYRCRKLPSAGALLKEEDSPDKQITFEV